MVRTPGWEQMRNNCAKFGAEYCNLKGKVDRRMDVDRLTTEATPWHRLKS